MIYLGTDIIDVRRIHKNIIEKDEIFLNKIFTKKEIEYCQLKFNPSIHFSGRFAGKEAVKKAILSSEVLNEISIKNIEILSSKNNAPVVRIKDINYGITVSISHTSNYAIATALLVIN